MQQEKFVLYADDDADDKEWVRDACATIDASFSLAFVDNGRQVLDYLLKRSPDQFPALIVLDLNMPELDGRQTLRKIKTHPLFQAIPVAIVTTSTNKIDRDVCRQLGAALFLSKPDSHSAWQAVARHLLSHIS